MEGLQEKEWRPVPIAEEFSSFDSGKSKGLNHLTQTSEGGIPYVSATNRNNGISCFVEEDGYSDRLIQEGNCIGFIKNGDGAAGYAIYKQEPFISTSDVLFGYAEWLTLSKGLFFVACQDKIERKYSHGYKRNRQHLAGDKVMLPVNANSEPDYDFMEQYVSDKMGGLLMRYKAFLKNQLAELEHVCIPALSEKEWKPFSIENIANVHGTTTTQPNDLIAGGKNPRVTCAATNNALDDFFANKTTETGNVLTVDSATIGTVFYQAYDFIATDHVEVIDPTIDNMNLYIGVFLTLAIQHSCGGKYMYGYKFSQQRIRRQSVMLPTTDAGKPDWAYMEQYAKNLMLKKYKQYLKFLEEQNL